MTNSKQAAERDYRSNEYLNFNKSAKYKSVDSIVAGHKSADALDKRDYENGTQDKQYVSRATTKQQRGNDKDSGYNDTEHEDPSLKENDSTEKDPQSATHGDGNMRYSRTRRSPRKWQLLPIHVAPIYHSRSSEPAPTVPPADDRRPYRRNLPPRMLAKLKQTSTTAAVTQDPVVVVTSCDDVKEDSNVEVSPTKVDVTNDATSRQNYGELESRDETYLSHRKRKMIMTRCRLIK